MKNTNPIPLDDLYSVEDFPSTNPKVLTLATLRWQLRSRRDSGLSSACVRVGHRIMISKSRYEQWLATQVESEGC